MLNITSDSRAGHEGNPARSDAESVVLNASVGRAIFEKHCMLCLKARCAEGWQTELQILRMR